MRIIFMGSAGFAVPALSALIDSEHDVIEVVAQPDKPAGRGQKVTACPVATCARESELPLYQPKGVRKPERIEHFRELAPDLIAVVAYGKILPRELIDIPKHGCINVHASLLPNYRGAAPIQWAIVNGDAETGVTTQRMVEELDAGDVLMAASTPIDACETARELHDRLALMGADLLLHTIEAIEEDTLVPIPQEPAQVTFAPIIEKADGRIDWTQSAQAIYNRVRGFAVWPGTFTTWQGKQLRLHEVAPVEGPCDAKPGTVVEVGDAHIAIACGEGMLYLLEVQLEGKRRMPVADFLRGHKVAPESILE